ncbi:MAG TPA: winged helix-turn-helix domain-containing protein [Gammaproteobacteria bacterium]
MTREAPEPKFGSVDAAREQASTSAADGAIFRFGDFELNAARRELRLHGRIVLLPARAFDLIVLLVANRHRIVGKDEILGALWPDAVVGDGALQRAISGARAALRTGGLGGAIRNHARRGYQFSPEWMRYHAPHGPGERQRGPDD